MQRVSAELPINIGNPVIFSYVTDYRNRIRLLPDNFTGARVLPPYEPGPGARFAFAITTDRGVYESITRMEDWDPPHSLSERTSDGTTSYTTHWYFDPEGEGTRVRVETLYEPTGIRLLRLLTARFERRALEQSLLVELLRLREALEAQPVFISDPNPQ